MKLDFLHLLAALLVWPFAATATEKVVIDGISYEEIPGEGMKVVGTTLSSINIPESISVNDTTYTVTQIGAHAFYGKQTLYEAVIPPTVKVINEEAFQASNIVNITLPEGLKQIKNDAFRGCKFLTEITIPSTVSFDDIDDGGQFLGSGLVKVVFNEGTTKVPDNAFRSCSSLVQVELPSSLRVVGENAFLDCVNLENISLPASLMQIKEGAFSGCRRLKSIELPPLMNTINTGTFKDCISLESIVMPANLTTIGYGSFQGCINLKSVAFPEKTTTIGALAFKNCSNLTEVYLPASLSSIGQEAFIYCDRLKQVHCRSLTPIPYNFVSEKTDTEPYILYVPKGKADTYRMSSYYEDFDKIEEESIGISMDTNRRLISGTTTKLTVNSIPSIYPLGSLSWTSSNTNVVSVDSYGTVKATNPGNAIITASTMADGEYISARCSIEVIDEPTSSFTIQPVVLATGATANIPVELINKSEIVAFQCDIYLPDGFEFATDEYGECDFRYAGRESRSHVLEYRKQSDGAMRVVGYSPTNATFKGNQGTLFYIPTLLPAQAGEYRICIKNILVTENSLQEQPLLDVEENVYVGASIAGDANSDGRLTISDAAVASAYILGEVADGFNFTNADVVIDGNITLSDVSEIVNRVLGVSSASYSKEMMKRSHGVQFPTREGDLISVENIDIRPGEEKAVNVSFQNNEPFTSFHVEIILPEGLNFVDEEGEYFIDIDSSRKTRSHTTACKLQEDGRLRALAYSSTNALFKGSEGNLFTFYIKASDNFDNTSPCKIRLENNYICNRNEEGQFTDYDVNNCESIVNRSSSIFELNNDNGVPAEYFDLMGRRVANPVPGSLYILRQGSKATKIRF